jgi:osmotically-inducible protein OsmY
VYGRERTGSYGGESYGRRSYGGYEGSFGGYGREGYGGREGRGLSERASGEAASWFGNRDAAPRREQDYRGRGPKGYRRSDDRIREDVNDRLTDDPYLDASDIDVSISHSEVTLNGTVDSRYARRRAEDLAENISGVIHVQNNLRVRQAQGGSDEIARGMSASGSGAAPGTEESSGRAGDSSR